MRVGGRWMLLGDYMHACTAQYWRVQAMDKRAPVTGPRCAWARILLIPAALPFMPCFFVNHVCLCLGIVCASMPTPTLAPGGTAQTNQSSWIDQTGVLSARSTHSDQGPKFILPLSHISLRNWLVPLNNALVYSWHIIVLDFYSVLESCSAWL